MSARLRGSQAPGAVTPALTESFVSHRLTLIWCEIANLAKLVMNVVNNKSYLTK